MNQLDQKNLNKSAKLTLTVEITFPKQQGTRDARSDPSCSILTVKFWPVDITADNHENFTLVKTTEFTIKGITLDILGFGPPTLANLLTVTVNHLPSQNNEEMEGELLAQAIMRKLQKTLNVTSPNLRSTDDIRS